MVRLPWHGVRTVQEFNAAVQAGMIRSARGLVDELCRTAQVEFSGVVTGAQDLDPKRRIFIRDGNHSDAESLAARGRG